jgi:hypothetical protein
VADKKRVRQTIKRLQRIKTWQLIILLILAGFISATFLRLNNIGMVQRRTAVLTADKVGDNSSTTERLYDLQQYVTAHMNTDMGKGIYLETLYETQRQAALNAESTADTPTGGIYKQINDACKAITTSYTPFFQCVTDRLAQVPDGSNTLTAIDLPSAAAYHYDFLSPLWSPDFAGWSILVCIVIALMIVARLISLAILRIILHQHYKSV